MRLKRFLITTLAFYAFASYSQNIVENGSFETITKKPKNPGEIFLAPPWVSGTVAAPDLYSSSAKDDLIKVPRNAYGDEKPKEGENYAGVLIYSHGGKQPRTYLSQQLKYKMLAGEHYCVKFHISFSDLSKYASNSIGVYISHDSIGSETDLILNYTPQIINSTNRIFEQQWAWEDICRIYVAEGGEQFLTLGNFAPQSEVLTKSVRRPKGYTTTQKRDGYYYVDDISVTPNATPASCKCEPGKFAFANLNPEEAKFETAEEDVPDRVIISTTGTIHGTTQNEEIKGDIYVQFVSGKSNLSGDAIEAIDEAIVYLNENETASISLVSHQDESEKVMKGLSEKRLNQVGKYILSKGISSDRISKSDVGTSEPRDTSGLKENRFDNMVVEIIFSN